MDENIKGIIEEGHLGVRTYEKFIDACLEKCASGDDDTVALYVLAKIAQPFWEFYREDPLTTDKAESFRHRLLGYIAKLEEKEAQDPEERLQVLKEIISTELNSPIG